MSNHDDFWTTLAAGHTNTVLAGSMDTHLSGKSIEESFGSVRTLTDMHRAANALVLPVEAGTKVAFAGNLGAHMSYDDAPADGTTGEVVTVKSATGEITHHGGKVFVKWADGKFRPIHAEHLRLVTSGKTADRKVARDEFRAGDKVTKKERPRGPLRGGGVGTVVSYNNRTKEVMVDWGSQMVGYVSANKLKKQASDIKAQFEKIKALAEKRPDSKFLKSLLKQMADKGFAPTDKQMAVVKKIEDEIEQQGEMKKELKSLSKAAAKSEHYALTDVRANDVDKVRIALEAAGYKVRPYQHKFSGHYVAMVEVEGDAKGIAKVMFPWVRKGDAQRVSEKDHFKSLSKAAGKPKFFFYEDFGSTIELAEELGWKDVHGDGDDDDYDADAIEEEAIEYIKRKGYSVITDVHHNRADPKVLKAMEKADAKTLRDIVKRFRGPHRSPYKTKAEELLKAKRADFDAGEIGKRKKAPIQMDDEDKDTVGNFGQGEHHDMTDAARGKTAMFRVASLGDLTDFLKVSNGALVHKSTKDLWSYSKDADGNFLVSRLFDDEGEPLKV